MKRDAKSRNATEVSAGAAASSPADSPESMLKVTQAVIESHRAAFARSRLIVLQHLKADTEEFLQHLQRVGAEICQVIAKPNSCVPEVYDRVAQQFPVILEEYEALESSTKLHEVLDAAIRASMADHRRVVVLDVGGYFAKPVATLRAKDAWPLAGVVEVTTFGHNRYRAVISGVEFPVFSVARSPIKELEARFVGAAVATAVERLLRERGRVMHGRRAVMNGFGMIGRSVAAALKHHGMSVSVTDKRAYPMVDAATLGYPTGTKRQVLPDAEFLLSATAQLNAISKAEFDLLPDQAYLVSAGSRTNEFDVHRLKTMATGHHAVSHAVDAYRYKGKTLNLVKQGKSVNFLVGSCQEEVMDLLFAEISTCLARLIQAPPNRLGQMHESDPADIEQISAAWLRLVRRVAFE